ncbi:50S ribosomal protein L1 [Candidatus Dependentiae bacterium]|nr:MAG: 50S ribosomal protein L1 [Candidatus Dependentiae bacterium]
MSKRGKKYADAKSTIASMNIGSVVETLDTVIKTATAKFDETVGVDIVLGIDATKGEQTVRGSVLLPHGVGKKVRVIVFAKGEHFEAAASAGADFVGAEDLVEKIESGWMEFDAAVATPDVMGLVGRVAKILGPRGLLPNKKIGTVTFDVAGIVKDLKQGRVSFRNDKAGVLHAPFGKISFGSGKLLDNLKDLVKSVQAHKPPTSKGKFIKKIVLSSTMGVGMPVQLEDILGR